MASKYFRQLGRTCNQISDELAGSDGFIATRDLLRRFGTEVIARPLLVEAMLASAEKMNANGGSRRHQWCLLVDSETHSFKESAVQNENAESTLPVRLRNTIAHELAHSLAFRTREFGVEIPRLQKKDSEKDFIAALERETEELSPLLLVSNKSLDVLFNKDVDHISLSEVLRTMRRSGTSRESFVNRLQLVETFDSLRILNRDCFFNFALGIGEWLSPNEAVLRPWPLLARFEGGQVPGFVFDLQRRTPVNPARVFHNPFSFAVGDVNIVSQTINGGTPTLPALRTLNARFSTETVEQSKGSEFMFLVQVMD